MTSNINVSAIDDTNPQKGQRASAIDERASRTAIKIQLNVARDEITELQSAVGNISGGGLTGFTDGNGFTSNITNNNLSLTLQDANATQSGQLTASSFNAFSAKGTSNLTLGNTSITAFQGDLGAGLLGNFTGHASNTSNPHNVTKEQIQLSNVTDVAPSDLPVSNATQAALNAKQGTLISGTNIKTINGNSVLGSGDMAITGGGNFTGIAGFTDGNGFTGNVTSNYLSLILQDANATQAGKLTADKFNDFESKGTSNLTIGSTNITAFQGDLGAGAVSNITALHGETGNLSASINVTNSNLGNATGNITALQNITTNLTDSKLNITDALVIGVTNLTAARGDHGATSYNHTMILSGNPHNVTASDVGLGNVSNIAPLDLPVSNATQASLDLKLDSSAYVNRFKGLFASLALLQAAFPTASAGDYAQVDSGAGSNLSIYAYDLDDGWVLVSSTGSGALNTDQLPEGSSNLYFTNARAVDALSATLSSYTPTNRTINGVALTSNVTLTTANISVSTNKNYVTDAGLTVLNATSGINTGDQNISGLVAKTTTINGVNLSSNITLTTAVIDSSADKRYVNETQLANINNISANHSNLTGLAWSNSGHTGSQNTVAGFLSNGTAVDYSTNGTGSVILNNAPSIISANLTTPTLGTPVSGNLTNCNGNATSLIAGNVSNLNITGNGTTSIAGILQAVNGGTGLTTLGALAIEIGKLLFPIGAIYPFNVSTNPATLLGFGTWVLHGAGRVAVCIDTGQSEFDTLGETGGEKTHTLTIAEMPTHNHPSRAFAAGVLAGGDGNTFGGLTDVTGDAGGGEAHNNLQPYIVEYRWVRTA